MSDRRRPADPGDPRGRRDPRGITPDPRHRRRGSSTPRPAGPRPPERAHHRAPRPVAAHRAPAPAQVREPRAPRPRRRHAQIGDAVVARPRAVRRLERRAPHRLRVPQRVFKAGQSRRRLLAVFILSTLVFAVVIAKVVVLQTTDAEALREAGRAQRTSERTLKAGRGVIFDRNGDELALSVPAVTIFADARLVTDPAGTARVLTDLLALSEEKHRSLLEAFTAGTSAFVYVARQVDEDLAAAVLDLGLNGIQGISEERRTMPGGEVGQGVIGRTDVDGIGTAGIEKQFDAVLTGTDGEQIRQHDKNGRSLPGTEATTVAPIPGDDVVLTIDRSVQYTVEQALVAQVEAVGARGGTAIVMSAKTGEIIAMASVRRDDETGAVEVTSGNFAAVDAYEPGSVVKVATIAAALNEGTVTPGTTFEVPAAKQYSKDKNDVYLHDAEPHPTEWWSVSDILRESSNIGTIETMLTMGDTLRETKEKQYNYLRAFGLGAKTALDFPGESVGIIKDWKEWEGTEQYTVAYGQGLASTSIQLVTAVNVLANGGTYVAPKLVKATIDASGTMTEAPPSATHRVVSEHAAAQVGMMMRQVVCNGTATRAQVDGVTIAGKTGTGLKAQDGGGYMDEDGNRTYYASFVGFFPAEDPEATVLVSIDEPASDQLTRFGGTAAAPVFAQIAPSIMHEMGFTPPSTGGGCPEG